MNRRERREERNGGRMRGEKAKQENERRGRGERA